MEAKFSIKGGTVGKVAELWRAGAVMKVSGGHAGGMCVFENKGEGERGGT